MLTKNMSQKELFISESLSVLMEKWFSKHKFLADIPILDQKYNHLRSKHQNGFYPFNNQLDYGFAHYFGESEIIKGNLDKF